MPKDPNPEFDSDYFEYEGAVLPSQIRPAISPSYARSGERLLMLAVLTDAINIFLRGATERRLSNETRDWIRGESTGSHAISFENACDALGIDPAAMREQLFRLKCRNLETEVKRRRSCLRVKPPAMSRGPAKIAAGLTSNRPAGRRRVKP